MRRNNSIRGLVVGLMLGAACGFAGLATPQAARAQGAAKALKVPFDLLKTQHMVISVEINGEGPFRLIFDTGSPVNLINTKVAAATGIAANDAPKNPLAGMLGGSGQQVKMKSLEIGPVKAEDLPAVIMNHPTVEALSKALGPVEGIIGYPFFARYRMTIDYQAREMTFVPNGFEPKDTLGSLQLTLLTGGKKKPAGLLAPSALWGLRLHKGDKDDAPGVNVAEVFAGSPAAAAGLRPGDRLLVVDDRWTDSVADCYSAAALVRPGTTVAIVIRREKAEQTLKLTARAGI